MMCRFSLAPALLIVVLGLPALAQPLPYEGRWDCEVATFTFTAETYTPGEGEAPLEILDSAEDEGSYVLTFADDYQIALTINPDGTMAWFSYASGDGFTCTPLP